MRFTTMLSHVTMPKLVSRSDAGRLVEEIRAHLAVMETTFRKDVEHAFREGVATSRAFGSHDHHLTISLLVTGTLSMDRFRGFAQGLVDAMADHGETESTSSRAPLPPDHTPFKLSRICMGANVHPASDQAIVARLRELSAEADQYGYDAAWHAWENATP